MKTPDWIDFMSNAPKKGNIKNWIFDLIPTITIANDEEGPALGIGWLFWTLIIFFPKWE